MTKNLLLEDEETNNTPSEETTSEKETAEDWEAQWNQVDDQGRDEIVKKLLKSLSKNPSEQKELENLFNSFKYSCFEFGVDPQSNPFIKYLPALVKEVSITPKDDSYVNKLVELSTRGHLSPNLISKAPKEEYSFLLNPSLFNRSLKDFEYTVKIWDIVSSPTQLKKFLKDVDQINLNELYVNGKAGDIIKPAGNASTAMDTDTIYGVIEAWSEGNELESNTPKNKSNIKMRPKYTQADLENISHTKRYNDLQHIPDSEKVEGNVVYVEFLGDMIKNQADPDNWIDTWMIYHNGKWSKYKD